MPAYPNLRCIDFCEYLEDPTARSLRWVPTQQVPNGAIVWVEEKQDYFHFERYSSRADDADTVINGMHGGKWIQGTGRRGRIAAEEYVEEIIATGDDETTLVSLQLRSCQVADHLTAMFTCWVDTNEEPGQFISVHYRLYADNVLWRSRWEDTIFTPAKKTVSFSERITVAANPSDPYVIHVTAEPGGDVEYTRSFLHVYSLG